MRPFLFRLDSLLRLRASDRDARRAELAQSLADQVRLNAELQSLERRLAEHQQQVRTLREPAELSLECLRQSESFRQMLTAERTRRATESAANVLQVNACQQRLAAAESEYQAVAKLKEARVAEYERDFRREEVKLADEAAGRCYRRLA